MKQRYRRYMNDIRPSDALMSRIEAQMRRELRQQRRKSSLPLRLSAAAACLAVVLLSAFAFRVFRPFTDVVTPPETACGATPVPTDATTAPATAPVPTASSTPQPAYGHPADDSRLELEMSGEAVLPPSALSGRQENEELFESHLAGAHNSSLVEICRSSDRNSVVISPLRPGTAWWPVTDAADSTVPLTDENGKEIGLAERVLYLDEASNTLQEGWKHTLYDADPLPEAPDNPVEWLQLPGKVTLEYAYLRYGADANALTVAALEKGQKLSLGYRVGNWIYASTAPFCLNSEMAFTGWIHIDDVVGLDWRKAINQVDLTADKVSLYDKPEGKVIAVLDKNTPVRYGGATIPGKKDEWHFVIADGMTGYIPAGSSSLNTFRLESELNLIEAYSATLTFTDDSPFGAAEQTVIGKALTPLLDRLNQASSESVCTAVCSEGSAWITLEIGFGSIVTLPLSGDGCTQVRYGDVVYDLKTDQERAERFLNDGGVGLSDILSPIFDQIRFP